MVPRSYQAPVIGSVTVRPNVNALRSQFESLETKNTKKTVVTPTTTARRTGKAQPAAMTEAGDVARATATDEFENGEGDDDVASEYGDDNIAVEVAVGAADEGSGRSTTEHYAEIATTNPYGEQSEEPKKEQLLDRGEYSDLPVRQTLTVPVSSPRREETMEETLGRLTRELEENHRAIEAEEKESLEFLQDMLSSLR